MKLVFPYLTLLFSILLSTQLHAIDSKVPKPFQGHDDDSKIVINYDDMTKVLGLSVLKMGKSMRKKAPKSKASIGTRLKSNRKIYTALEGNRFLFRSFKDKNYKVILTQIKHSLEKVPDEVPFKHLSQKEQLAYWLNIYNVSLLEKLIDVYPKSKLKKTIYGDDGILNQKILKISGLELSLNDIKENIIFEKFGSNPVVMYGLYQGIIGGPNLRAEAYTGEKVYTQLDSNADEFVNSNRGTFWDSRKKTMRVSSFYQQNEKLFPEFKQDLKKHLLQYMDSRYTFLMGKSKKLKTNISDMAINDITGGSRRYGGSVNTNGAAMLESVAARLPNIGAFQGAGIAAPSMLASSYQDKTESYQRFSPDVVKMLKIMRLNPELKKGIVNIKEDKKKDSDN